MTTTPPTPTFFVVVVVVVNLILNLNFFSVTPKIVNERVRERDRARKKDR